MLLGADGMLDENREKRNLYGGGKDATVEELPQESQLDARREVGKPEARFKVNFFLKVYMPRVQDLAVNRNVNTPEAPPTSAKMKAMKLDSRFPSFMVISFALHFAAR